MTQDAHYNSSGGKPGLKPKKIDFSIMSQVIIFLNLCRKTTLYLKSIHKKLHFSTSLICKSVITTGLKHQFFYYTSGHVALVWKTLTK